MNTESSLNIGGSLISVKTSLLIFREALQNSKNLISNPLGLLGLCEWELVLATKASMFVLMTLAVVSLVQVALETTLESAAERIESARPAKNPIKDSLLKMTSLQALESKIVLRKVPTLEPNWLQLLEVISE